MNSFTDRPTFQARLNSGALLTGVFSGKLAYSWNEVDWNTSGLPVNAAGGRQGICISGQPIGISQYPAIERNHYPITSFPYYTELTETFLSYDNGTSTHEFNANAPATVRSLSVSLQSGATAPSSGFVGSGIQRISFNRSDGFITSGFVATGSPTSGYISIGMQPASISGNGMVTNRNQAFTAGKVFASGLYTRRATFTDDGGMLLSGQLPHFAGPFGGPIINYPYTSIVPISFSGDPGIAVTQAGTYDTIVNNDLNWPESGCLQANTIRNRTTVFYPYHQLPTTIGNAFGTPSPNPGLLGINSAASIGTCVRSLGTQGVAFGIGVHNDIVTTNVENNSGQPSQLRDITCGKVVLNEVIFYSVSSGYDGLVDVAGELLRCTFRGKINTLEGNAALSGSYSIFMGAFEEVAVRNNPTQSGSESPDPTAGFWGSTIRASSGGYQIYPNSGNLLVGQKLPLHTTSRFGPFSGYDVTYQFDGGILVSVVSGWSDYR